MEATYATILLVSALRGEPQDHVAHAFKSEWDCSQMLGLGADVWHDNNMMARCIKTRIITSTSTPMMRPDDLMEAYND